MSALTRRDWCKTLCYRDGRTWRNLPPWATSLIDIGWTIGNHPIGEEKLSVVIVVPNRRFASALLALGYLLAEPVPAPSVQDLDKHFADLLALPDARFTQTSLIYLSNGRSIHGLFEGVRDVEGEPRIGVCVQEKASDRSGGLTLFIDRARAGELHIDPEPPDRLGRNVNGRAILKNRSFVKNVYETTESARLHTLGLPTVCIVGRQNALRAETLEEVFACQEGNGLINEGVLNDIIKVDRFLPTSLRPRVRLIPTASEDSLSALDDTLPKVVILDGSDSHLKWSHAFKSKDSISVFCLRDSQLDDAVANINERYGMRSERQNDKILNDLVGLRARFDGTAFWEIRR
jgi:hypothetical protein